MNTNQSIFISGTKSTNDENSLELSFVFLCFLDDVALDSSVLQCSRDSGTGVSPSFKGCTIFSFYNVSIYIKWREELLNYSALKPMYTKKKKKEL